MNICLYIYIYIYLYIYINEIKGTYYQNNTTYSKNTET